MKKIIVSTAIAAAALAATPALANEGRVEARGGIAWANGDSEAVAGVAAGYDWDLGNSGFVGLEASADKILVDGADVIFGATVRGGVKTSPNGKLFAAAGYSFGNDDDAFHLGAGYQHKFGQNFYGKIEYRHFFTDIVEINTAAIGLGYAF